MDRASIVHSSRSCENMIMMPNVLLALYEGSFSAASPLSFLIEQVHQTCNFVLLLSKQDRVQCVIVDVDVLVVIHVVIAVRCVVFVDVAEGGESRLLLSLDLFENMLLLRGGWIP
jgi:hypothetical protein